MIETWLDEGQPPEAAVDTCYTNGLDLVASGDDVWNGVTTDDVLEEIPRVREDLGMIPLVPDAFFVAMAVTIMFGLAFATVLTLVVVPVLFGLAVDGSVHMMTRVQSGIELSEAVSETARAIFGALLTTALGFGALMLSEHPGLDSIGAVAVVGLAVNAWLTLVVLPAAIALVRPAATKGRG